MDDSIGTRLCRLCTTPTGRLLGLRFHDHGARAATLIDLVLARRVSRSVDGVLHASATPTGVVAADRMLAHIARYEGAATADRILSKAPVRMRDHLSDQPTG